MGDIGPFTNSSNMGNLRSLAHSLTAIELSFQLRNTGFFHGIAHCFLWTIRVAYSFTSRARLDLTIDASADVCSVSDAAGVQSPGSTALAALTLLVACLLQVLQFRAILHSFYNYRRLKARNEVARSRASTADLAFVDFGQLSCADRMRFFNVWFFVRCAWAWVRMSFHFLL